MTRPAAPEQALVQELRSLRKSMEADARRMSEVAQTLHRMARRQPSDMVSTYVTYASAWLRLANVVGLGLRRTSIVDRLLAQAEVRHVEDVPEVRSEAQPADGFYLTSDKDFETLYGEALNAQ